VSLLTFLPLCERSILQVVVVNGHGKVAQLSDVVVDGGHGKVAQLSDVVVDGGHGEVAQLSEVVVDRVSSTTS